MQQLIITKGLPGSGKTTFARQWVNEDSKKRVRVNRDDIRRMLGPYWVPTREDLVTTIEDQMIGNALEAGYSVISDNTNFKGNYRFEMLIELSLTAEPVELIIKDFTDVPLEVCLVRDRLRSKDQQVGDEVIMNFYNKYIKK